MNIHSINNPVTLLSAIVAMLHGNELSISRTEFLHVVMKSNFELRVIDDPKADRIIVKVKRITPFSMN